MVAWRKRNFISAPATADAKAPTAEDETHLMQAAYDAALSAEKILVPPPAAPPQFVPPQEALRMPSFHAVATSAEVAAAAAAGRAGADGGVTVV